MFLPFFTFTTLKIKLQNPKHCFYVIFNKVCNSQQRKRRTTKSNLKTSIYCKIRLVANMVQDELRNKSTGIIHNDWCQNRHRCDDDGNFLKFRNFPKFQSWDIFWSSCEKLWISHSEHIWSIGHSHPMRRLAWQTSFSSDWNSFDLIM